MPSLHLKNVAQLKDVKVDFKDITIIVGNQAVGKSIFLQMCKLINDMGYIKSKLNYHGYSFGNFESFLDLYFGEGMRGIIDKDSEIIFNNKKIDLKDKLEKSRNSYMKNFYIPAQRVLMLEYGYIKPFTSFDITYPYVLKEFSELVRFEIDKSLNDEIFPQLNKLKKELREIISKHIYKGEIKVKNVGNRKQIVMDIGNNSYSLGSWSAGQKEFAPFLFGLYWALPSAKVSTREKVKIITIEEPEMGLHPNAIIDTMALIFELSNRGYKIVLSTHSNTILELFWTLGELKNYYDDSKYEKFLQIFDLPKNNSMREFAKNVLNKKFKIYYFKDEDGVVSKDITKLDLDSDDDWGELNKFSSVFNEIVASIYQRS